MVFRGPNAQYDKSRDPGFRKLLDNGSEYDMIECLNEGLDPPPISFRAKGKKETEFPMKTVGKPE